MSPRMSVCSSPKENMVLLTKVPVKFCANVSPLSQLGSFSSSPVLPGFWSDTESWGQSQAIFPPGQEGQGPAEATHNQSFQ